MHIPDFMPVLKGGSHNEAKEGACVMEYIAFITQPEEFTDTPRCTPRGLARLAQYANDLQLSDEDRTRLMLPLMPRLIGAGQSMKFDRALADFLFEKGMASNEEIKQDNFVRFEDITPPIKRGDVTHQRRRIGNDMCGLIPFIFDPFSKDRTLIVDLLIECLDEYDKFLGRETPSLTEEQTADMHALAALIGG
jgi:hypothetical protein